MAITPTTRSQAEVIAEWEAAGLVRVTSRSAQLSYALRALGFVAHGITTGTQERACYTTPDGATYAEILNKAPIAMHMRRSNMVARLTADPELRDAFRAAWQLGAEPRALRAMIEEGSW
jgi:hypothetical protein